MGRKRKDTPAPKKEGGKDDAALWDAVKASAKPVKRDTIFRDLLTGTTAPPPAEPEKKPRRKRTAPPASLAPELPMPAKQPRRELRHGCSPGVDRRTAERLHRGKMAIEGRLDLHGMSREAAHTATLGFVSAARLSGKRCILIVTGKGKGILQTELPRWLNMSPLRDQILSFSHARPQDGGTGAVYVLLKRDRSLP